MRKGNLFVISGPSGAGKGTLVARLIASVPDSWVSISMTTRQPRVGEVDGVHYFFKSRDEFMANVEAGNMLEWAEYSKNCYGTPLSSVRQHMDAGEQVILEIEVQGALQVRAKLPEAHLVFVQPPSLQVLEERLRGRGTEAEEAIQLRLQTAAGEMKMADQYDKTIVNDDLDTAVAELVGYVNALAEG